MTFKAIVTSHEILKCYLRFSRDGSVFHLSMYTLHVPNKSLEILKILSVLATSLSMQNVVDAINVKNPTTLIRRRQLLEGKCLMILVNFSMGTVLLQYGL